MLHWRHSSLDHAPSMLSSAIPNLEGNWLHSSHMRPSRGLLSPLQALSSSSAEGKVQSSPKSFMSPGKQARPSLYTCRTSTSPLLLCPLQCSTRPLTRPNTAHLPRRMQVKEGQSSAMERCTARYPAARLNVIVNSIVIVIVTPGVEAYLVHSVHLRYRPMRPFSLWMTEHLISRKRSQEGGGSTTSGLARCHVKFHQT